MPTPRSTRSQLATDGKTISGLEFEKSTPYPMCYGNLLAGRTTNVSISTSPGQPNQPGKKIHVKHNLKGIVAPTFVLVFTAVSDDEAEVPSRNSLKRQALLIVDSKARRKGYARRK